MIALLLFVDNDGIMILLGVDQVECWLVRFTLTKMLDVKILLTKHY